MSPDYPRRAIAPSGLTERKWRLVRQQCRAWAQERGEDVLGLYAQEGVLTPREAETLADPNRAYQRERWRIAKMRLRAENERLQAEIARLRDVLELVVSTHDNGGWPSAVMVIARAALAEQEKKP